MNAHVRHSSSWLRHLIGCVLLATALAPARASAAKQLYTCGMHPQIIRKEPGDCPICGMKLTPIRENAGSGEMRIALDAGTIQQMNLKTAEVEEGPVRREIRAVGNVAYNEEGLTDVTTKYEGWIEKLYVNATWTTIREGDALFDMYSPELYNAQLNYLVARRSEGEKGGPFTTAAIDRLRLFDIPQSFIDDLASRGSPARTFTYHAPTGGVVVEKMAVQGQMMKPGERIYRLADLSTVWVLVQIYENDLPFVHEDQPVTVRATYGPERTFTGKVDLLLPQVEEQTRTTTARLVLENPDGFLRPGMFVDVRFDSKIADSAVLVPDIAVLRSGERNTVFVALDGGRFEPREVKLGARSSGNFYQVESGLKAGERVVTSGQFMLDSESQLREAIQKMVRSETADDAPTSSPVDAPTATPGATMAHATHDHGDQLVLYTCPMEQDADVVTDHPGKCPKCGMKLVPTASVPHGAKAEKIWHERHP